MKKIISFLIVFVFVIQGCGNSQKSGLNQATEMSYSDFKNTCDLFWDVWIEETEKLSDVELYGTEDDEEKQYWNMIQKWNDCASNILKESEVQQGQKIRISGYIEEVAEVPEDSESIKYWPDRKFIFSIKHNAEDENYEGIYCQSSDKAFLNLKENAAVTIEGIFIKEGNINEWSESLYDCHIVSE